MDVDSDPIALPHVGPIGIVEQPDDFESKPRTYPRLLRSLAFVLLALFLIVLVATTFVSLGGYCLTTDGADTHALPARFLKGHTSRR
jgi:hypothetical protein